MNGDWGNYGTLMELFAIPDLFLGFTTFAIVLYTARVLRRSDGSGESE